MARLFTSGAELTATGALTSLAPEGFTGQNTPTITSSPTRTGSRAFDCSTTSNTSRMIRVDNAGFWTATLGRTYHLRAYARVDTLPSATTSLLSIFNSNGTATNGFMVRITPGGVLQLWNMQAGAQIGSDDPDTVTAGDGRWHRLELSVNYGAGNLDDAGEFQHEGASVASASGVTSGASGPVAFMAGWHDTPGTGTRSLYFDDLAFNDDQGVSQNSWPGAGAVVGLLPISDNARDTLWTGGAGGTSNLWDAVDNRNPAGLVSASATNTSQIEHAGGAAGTTDRYDANMTTYATAGVTESDTVKVVQFLEVDGEDIAVGSKLLNFEVLSNPVIASPGNVTAGDNAGAVGTWPTNWTARTSPPVYAPSVVVDTSPVMRVRRPETASRVASVCFMGMTVDYTPGQPPATRTFDPIPFYTPKGRSL